MNGQYSRQIRFILNGEEVALDAISPRQTLLDWLRLDRRLTGSKEGCAEGDCGACTVLIGRLVCGLLVYESVNSCIRFMGSLHGTHVVTVEHLKGKDGLLHPVQQAMVDCHGSQCGFCTPGFVMSLYGLWLTDSNPSRERIEQALQGNLCRCTGYEPIVKAAEMAARIRPADVFDPIEATRRDVQTRLADIARDGTVQVSHEGDELYVPATISDLAEILGAHPHATVVAGSTDVGLWVTKQFRSINPVIFINNLEALQTISENDDAIVIGAGVTYTHALATLVKTHPAFGKLLPRIGGEQVRNMGTIGGNVANGSPIGDTPPALIALGASVALRSQEGARELALEDFFIDYGKQDRQRHEFVDSLKVPMVPEGVRFSVYKISKRRDEDITAVLGAFYLKLDDNEKVEEIRLAYGGMAGIPKRATSVENALLGRAWTEANVKAAAAELDQNFTPLSDWRATAEYRMLTARNLLTRFYLESQGQEAELVRFAAGAGR
ncbi:xanthine dehydrogenase small subunit [Rhizobium sp. KVB221]|uniref:Xanthine dehydrogenase small subunit n=1 Tax=Rhizobium setariae TaxID=2801340 RepID=A0A937CLV6_9HYPH|nr:xanthine dehydrogenase small subunit [Rhizobium setariae]MBL0372081.1 xanthine dehydrogenase small subunit [Rhizobium setariae]